MHQLADQSEELSPHLRSIYQKYPSASSRPPPSLGDCEDALGFEVQRFGSVYVIVDALDECKNDDGGDFEPGTGISLLRTFASLGQKIRLSITSRLENPGDLDVEAVTVDSFKKMKVLTTKEDIMSYIQGRITQNHWLQRYTDAPLVEEIKKTIATKAAGM